MVAAIVSVHGDSRENPLVLPISRGIFSGRGRELKPLCNALWAVRTLSVAGSIAFLKEMICKLYSIWVGRCQGWHLATTVLPSHSRCSIHRGMQGGQGLWLCRAGGQPASPCSS